MFLMKVSFATLQFTDLVLCVISSCYSLNKLKAELKIKTFVWHVASDQVIASGLKTSS